MIFYDMNCDYIVFSICLVKALLMEQFCFCYVGLFLVKIIYETETDS